MKNFFILITIILVFVSCNNENIGQRYELMGQAQGTYYKIIYYNNSQSITNIQIDSLMDAFNYSASTYQKNSIISNVNNNIKTEYDADFLSIFKTAQKISIETDGAFDITVLPLVKAWGFHYEERQKLTKEQVDSVLDFVGYDKIIYENDSIKKIDPRVRIDYNAIAQGYSVDLVGKFFDEQNIQSYLIDIGGEMLSKGKKPSEMYWKVGIQKAEDSKVMTDQLQDIIMLHNKAMATSGNYRKFFIGEDGVKYSHTINPKTGYPVKHTLLSATVIAEDCCSADAYATAFMVMGLDKAKLFADNKKGLEAYFIYSDENGEYKVYFTEGFKKMIIE